MPPIDALTADDLLHVLLDRYEAPKARARDITQPIDYTRIGDPLAQDRFHQVLQDAARVGAIQLEQERVGRFTGEYARVRLIDAQALYRFLVRVPAGTSADIAWQAIATSNHALLQEPFFAGLIQEAVQAWRGNKKFLGFDVSEVGDFLTVLKLTHGILHLAGRDIDHRTFSRRAVKDSKALERWEGRVSQLLKRKNPELAADEPREVLEASGIVRRAHLLQLKGPLQLATEAFNLAGTGAPFIGLPWGVVERATLARPVDYIVTIENPTSFWRYCSEIDGCYLALLTDGFPARDVLSGMVHIVQMAHRLSPSPLFHWGDIDAGGLRIAAHLEDSLGYPVHLHQMRIDDALQHGSQLSSRQGLNRLAQRPGDIGQLASWLNSPGGRALEQEELDPIPPLLP
jgi:Uncharacterized protein conserved in bacteria C-term(DUF2220)